MKETTKNEIIETFRKYNEQNNVHYGQSTDVPQISAIIVYAKDNWKHNYTEAERSYRVTNTAGKMFFNGMLGASIFGDCLDGTDLGVRLDWYG